MKNRLTTLDIAYLIYDLRQKLVGLRVEQIYDIDKKTYLIRFAKSGSKKVLLLESGTRCHTTSFEWPKNPAPSGFSMKLRKHLNNKRLEKIEQVGADRIVHLQFGTDDVAHHLLLELYDKGNIILTDHKFIILSLLRPRIQGEERFAAYETYTLDRAKQNFSLDQKQIDEILESTTKGTLREVFLSKLEFGPTLFSHVLKSVELTPQSKITDLIATENGLSLTKAKLFTAFEEGRSILENISNPKGMILLSKQGSGTKADGNTSKLTEGQEAPIFYDQFHPLVLLQSFESENILEFESFDEAVDEFFSKVESQKLDMKQLNQERDAIKKLEKVKLDQNKRLKELQEGQETDKQKAELITVNQAAVDTAISAIRKLVANQIPWSEIDDQLKVARSIGDPLASMISKLNLKQNSITLNLRDPYDEEHKMLTIDVDLNLSAYSNATKYFDLKKASARKEERTLESQDKAFKSTEKKTMASLKEAATIHSIKKARKVLWFEKFRWFISSENFLIIGGRDAQQNEILVKKYLRPTDIYMHADSHGAPTLIIKNDNSNENVPPKTLNETGVFAISCSGSWESKVVVSCWWVWGDQVSKSAPTGEYLPTGSFMIRGKKNYLPACQLVLGFGFLFRLTEDCVEAHKNERARKTLNDSSENLPQYDEPLTMEEEFPDTHVDLKMDGDKVKTRLESMGETHQDFENEDTHSSEFFVTSGVTGALNSVQKLKNKQKKADKNQKLKAKQCKPENLPVKVTPDESTDISQLPKRGIRGQHGRKKKLKEKYKFQDDEERQLRMQLIRTGQAASNVIETVAGSSTDEVLGENERDLENNKEEVPEVDQEEGLNKATAIESTEIEVNEIIPSNETFAEETEQEETHETELDLLKSLTGSPVENDELLYAVAVVAPYTTLQNYKFRIKMTPGTTKRGKAAKTALESFLRDKEATPRERDLIKAVKDQDLARNFPGKVKLSNIIREKK